MTKEIKVIDLGDTLALDFDFDRDFYDGLLYHCSLFNHVQRGRRVTGYLNNTDDNLAWLEDVAPDYFDDAVFVKNGRAIDLKTGDDTGELTLF